MKRLRPNVWVWHNDTPGYESGLYCVSMVEPQWYRARGRWEHIDEVYLCSDTIKLVTGGPLPVGTELFALHVSGKILAEYVYE